MNQLQDQFEQALVDARRARLEGNFDLAATFLVKAIECERKMFIQLPETAQSEVGGSYDAYAAQYSDAWKLQGEIKTEAAQQALDVQERRQAVQMILDRLGKSDPLDLGFPEMILVPGFWCPQCQKAVATQTISCPECSWKANLATSEPKVSPVPEVGVSGFNGMTESAGGQETHSVTQPRRQTVPRTTARTSESSTGFSLSGNAIFFISLGFALLVSVFAYRVSYQSLVQPIVREQEELLRKSVEEISAGNLNQSREFLRQTESLHSSRQRKRDEATTKGLVAGLIAFAFLAAFGFIFLKSPASETGIGVADEDATPTFGFSSEMLGASPGAIVRAVAFAIDGAVFLAILLTLSAPLSLGSEDFRLLFGIFFANLYWPLWESSSFQGGPGKIAMGIRVQTFDGQAPSLVRCFFRNFLKSVFFYILLIVMKTKQLGMLADFAGLATLVSYASNLVVYDLMTGCVVVKSPPEKKPIKRLSPPAKSIPAIVTLPCDEEYRESDNLGSRIATDSEADIYWAARHASPRKEPFLLYAFPNETAARAALLDLSEIKVAKDSGKLICLETLNFGCYSTGTQYEAMIAGSDMSKELFLRARDRFQKHGGKPVGTGELEPEGRSPPRGVRETLDR
jgi:uncharacterized RDD family membrane protein YckC